MISRANSIVKKIIPWYNSSKVQKNKENSLFFEIQLYFFAPTAEYLYCTI